VVVLRDGDDGLEVLMLRRDKDLSFAGGTWVFPGGRIDPADHSPSVGPPTEGDALEAAARRAAVREAAEEAGLTLDHADLVRWSHWTPPPQSPKRFSTAFFVAALVDGDAEVVIDDGEIREHRWLAPAEALELRAAGHIGLTPPTFITLSQLMTHTCVSDVLARAAQQDTPEHFSTRIRVCDDRVLALYHGDSDYEDEESLDLSDPPTGPRHRLTMGAVWTYERTT
jgi:8-oxo-dGTP pyrophosphatase MutT (NUDIX family)